MDSIFGIATNKVKPESRIFYDEHPTISNTRYRCILGQTLKCAYVDMAHRPDVFHR